MTKYTLQSAGFCHAPSLVSWARNAYKFDKNPKMIDILVEGYGLPKDVTVKLLNGDIEFHVVGLDVIFYVQDVAL